MPTARVFFPFSKGGAMCNFFPQFIKTCGMPDEFNTFKINLLN